MDHYEAAAEAHLAPRKRVAEGRPIDRVASAASLFVSRVDTEVDKRIGAVGARLATLRGIAATANARLVYASFLDIVGYPRFHCPRVDTSRAAP